MPFFAPSERADIIVDFAGHAGASFTLTNDAQVPFPSGNPLDPADPTRQVLQLQVSLPLSSRDTTFNPALGGSLRGGPNREPLIARLVDPVRGQLAPGVHPSATRQLVAIDPNTGAPTYTAAWAAMPASSTGMRSVGHPRPPPSAASRPARTCSPSTPASVPATCCTATSWTTRTTR